jgi:hypothetical protein
MGQQGFFQDDANVEEKHMEEDVQEATGGHKNMVLQWFVLNNPCYVTIPVHSLLLQSVSCYFRVLRH